MCTVTWLRSGEDYALLFNRDELLTRREALPPSVREREGVRYLAPTDGDFGGSWISVSDRGVTLGILNGYRAPDERGEYRSRGLLLEDLATVDGVEELEERLKAVDLGRYRSFRLLALTPFAARIFEWDRRSLAIDRDAGRRVPLVSSSFEETEVGMRRREEWAARTRRAPAALAALEAYHRSHAGGPSAYSVCMHRAEAATRSLARADVSAREVSLRYQAGAPCRGAEAVTLRLPRAALSQASAEGGEPARES
jgi:hypothetical protein